MQESFLRYIWKFQYFNHNELQTQDGRTVKVFKQGVSNNDSGPDFSDARIQIDKIEWVGNVEIHHKASEWYRHGHDTDPAYDSVILHVVWSYDRPVMQRDGVTMPTLELKNRVAPSLIHRYRKLVENPSIIPCEKKISRVEKLTKLSMLEKTALHRLENKATRMVELLQANNNDWEETTYQLIAQNFGFKTNREPFLQLTRAIPLKMLLKHSDNLVQIEALLFGQGGFLELKTADEYVRMLQREYTILSKKYRLEKHRLHRSIWKFLRLRPANFPTLRIAQFSALICAVKSLFSRLTTVETIEQLRDLFAAAPSDYWRTHYHFEKKTDPISSRLGKQSIDNLIINTVAPLLVSYGQLQDRQDVVERALDLLQHIPPEKNNIIKKWNTVDFIPNSALESQGLIELYNNFCLKRRCLSCAIGVAILKPAP